MGIKSIELGGVYHQVDTHRLVLFALELPGQETFEVLKSIERFFKPPFYLNQSGDVDKFSRQQKVVPWSYFTVTRCKPC